MIVPVPRRPRRTEDNILPLINIVFLLLIFFMLAGSMITQPPFELTPPNTANAADSEIEADILSLSADGRLGWGGEVLSLEELSPRLGDWDPEEALIVKADADLPASDLTELLADLRGLGIAKIRLLTLNNL